MRRPLCGCSPTRLDCELTIHECALLLRRREPMSWHVFLPKPASSGALATNSVRRFGRQIFLPFWSTRKFRCRRRKFSPCLTLRRYRPLYSRPRSLPIAGSGATAVLDFLSRSRNDLETAAIWAVLAIAAVLKDCTQVPEVKATGMSGSGATCFALFADRRRAAAARRVIAAEHPGWWVEATDIH